MTRKKSTPAAAAANNAPTWKLSQRHIPIPHVFPGLWHGKDAEWQPEFVKQLRCKHSALHRKFKTYRGEANPDFSTTQLICLALLAQPDRVGDYATIYRWTQVNFPYFASEETVDLRGETIGMHSPLLQKLWNTLDAEVKSYDTNFPSHATEVDGPNNKKLKAFRLPPGRENVIFRPHYHETAIPGECCHFAPLDIEVPTNSLISNLSDELVCKVLSSVLVFDEKLVVHRQQHHFTLEALKSSYPSPTGAVIGTAGCASYELPDNKNLFAILRVNKHMRALGLEVFFGKNAFLLYTLHFSPLTWLRLIGTPNLHRLYRVEIDMYCAQRVQKYSDINNAFRTLGESEGLHELTLHLHMVTYSTVSYENHAKIPGMKYVVKYKGITELTVTGTSGRTESVREYLEDILTPWKKLERRIVALEECSGNGDQIPRDGEEEMDRKDIVWYEKKKFRIEKLEARVKELKNEAQQYQGPKIPKKQPKRPRVPKKTATMISTTLELTLSKGDAMELEDATQNKTAAAIAPPTTKKSIASTKSEASSDSTPTKGHGKAQHELARG
ncbi:hypothetical protein BCR34DRAFT_618388 [Clohesyomyces aquaticus]|uniref:Uncharacterized protein n=1 Tax=Clohesyomyces aquaticus TaxID=1231657 RepID=A0A1Y1YTI5_9PLEO|nr:hypothetical protein BCR34DRAFT_618388 [Clohesyomyces aquaticus]